MFGRVIVDAPDVPTWFFADVAARASGPEIVMLHLIHERDEARAWWRVSTREPRSIDRSIDRSSRPIDRSFLGSVMPSPSRARACRPRLLYSSTLDLQPPEPAGPRLEQPSCMAVTYISVVKGSNPDVRHVIHTQVETRLEQPVLRRHGSEEVALLDQREPVVPRQARTPHTSSHHEKQPQGVATAFNQRRW